MAIDYAAGTPTGHRVVDAESVFELDVMVAADVPVLNRRCQTTAAVALVAAGLVALFGGLRSAPLTSPRPFGFISEQDMDMKMGMGCSNWASIVLEKLHGKNASECQEACGINDACVQFNFEADDCSTPGEGSEANTCYLYDGHCEEEPNSCWQLGAKPSPTPSPTPSPAPSPTSNCRQLAPARRLNCERDRYRHNTLGVTGLPPQEDWQDVFRRVVSTASVDDVRPPLHAFFRFSAAGTTSRLNNFVNEVFAAMATQTPIVLCIPEGEYDVWMEHFDDSGLFAMRSGACGFPGLNLTDCSRLPNTPMDGAGASAALDPDSVADMKRFLHQKLFTPAERESERIATAMDDLGLTGVPYVGVHVRRGDKFLELHGKPFLDYQVFADEILKQRADVGANMVFVASDDDYAASNLSALLPDMQVVEQKRLDAQMYSMRNFDFSDTSLVRAGEDNFLIDLELLVRSSAFVGTASSNVGRFVFFSRGKETPSVTLDEDFLYRNC